jgi:uncharacterized protein YjbJ (UPF0337 family)
VLTIAKGSIATSFRNRLRHRIARFKAVLLQLKEENTSMADKDTDKDLGKKGTQDTVAGKAKEVAGKVQKNVGKAVRNKEMEAKGKVREAGGKAQAEAGQVERKADKALDE